MKPVSQNSQVANRCTSGTGGRDGTILRTIVRNGFMKTPTSCAMNRAKCEPIASTSHCKALLPPPRRPQYSAHREPAHGMTRYCACPIAMSIQPRLHAAQRVAQNPRTSQEHLDAKHILKTSLTAMPVYQEPTDRTARYRAPYLAIGSRARVQAPERIAQRARQSRVHLAIQCTLWNPSNAKCRTSRTSGRNSTIWHTVPRHGIAITHTSCRKDRAKCETIASTSRQEADLRTHLIIARVFSPSRYDSPRVFLRLEIHGLI